jgi:hypothetical protein
MIEALSFYETSVLTRDTGSNIPEDTILHSHRRENLKSYNKNEFGIVTGKFADIFIYFLSGWSGTQSTINEVAY